MREAGELGVAVTVAVPRPVRSEPVPTGVTRRRTRLCEVLDLTDPETGALRATVTRRELARLVRRGCRSHPTTDCSCAVLHRPPPVRRYAPTPAQRRFVSARDRGCRFTGCRRPVERTDLDHVCAHRTGGATDCGNLCCLCRRHHRLKTHARAGTSR